MHLSWDCGIANMASCILQSAFRNSSLCFRHQHIQVPGLASQGITGFGNAIINLLVWVAFTAAGVNASPLQMAVLADSVGCVVCSIPLLVMTSAHKTADWKLVITIFAFTSAGAPLGAALLTHLAVRWVEFAMGCVLLLVICLHVKLLETVRNKLHKWCANHRSISASQNALPSNANLDGEDVAIVCPVARLSSEAPAALMTLAASVDSVGAHLQDSPASRSCARPTGETEVPAAASMGRPKKGTGSVAVTCFGTHHCCCIAKDAQVTTSPIKRAQSDHVATQLEQCHDCRHGDVETVVFVGQVGAAAADTEPLLEPGALTSDATLPLQPIWAGGSTASKCYVADRFGSTKEAIRARFRRCLQRQDWKEIRRIIFFGSLSGFASGVMGGMTGIGGPPLMFMYEKLKVAKDVVRGTNAVNNILQVRLVSYVAMGVYKREDMMIYAVTSVMGLAGVILGNGLAGQLDQRGFSRVLNVLMIICCVLLFASAAGLKGHAA
ncbi:hypothetical protein VaNZ11_009101 [Volvox africanus]|uniref:Membrane transporter protein n=1 Tax=Volvox africanus TaxID=51714 RepID=A0ABQ5S7Q6_9CHLO|nr:hypothetical protein VaNZ11_009101 [Volvox africanus]